MKTFDRAKKEHIIKKKVGIDMIKYQKLFDLLNRRGMKKIDLLEILSSKTIAKISKGANLNTEVIDTICMFLDCQPGDIMECVKDLPPKEIMTNV